MPEGGGMKGEDGVTLGACLFTKEIVAMGGERVGL
jgi:hypothetical protein